MGCGLPVLRRPEAAKSLEPKSKEAEADSLQTLDHKPLLRTSIWVWGLARDNAGFDPRPFHDLASGKPKLQAYIADRANSTCVTCVS